MQSLLIMPLQRERTWRGGEWGVSPHTVREKYAIATHWTLEEGRGDITGGERGDKIHENRHSICTDFKQNQDFAQLILTMSLSHCYLSLI